MAWIRAVQGDTFGWRWDDPERGKYGEHFVPAKMRDDFSGVDWETPPDYTPIPLDNRGAGLNQQLTSGGVPVVMGMDQLYYRSDDPNRPADASLASAGGYSSDNGGGMFDGLKNTLSAIVSNPANQFFAATTGLGGMTLANAATGGDVGAGVQQDLTTLASTIGGQYLAGQGAFAPEVANSGVDFGGPGVGWTPDTVTGATPTLVETPVAQAFPVSEPTSLAQLTGTPSTFADQVTNAYQTYLGRAPEPGIVDSWYNWTDGDINRVINQHLIPSPEAEAYRASLNNPVTFTQAPDYSFVPQGVGNVGLNVSPEATSLESAIAGASTAGGVSGITPGLATENAITGLGTGLTVPGVPGATGLGTTGLIGAAGLGMGLGAAELGSAAAGGTAAGLLAPAATAAGAGAAAGTAAAAGAGGLGATKVGDLLKSESPVSDLLGQLTLGNLGTLGAAGLGAYASNEMGNKLAEIAAAQREADQSRYQDLVSREDARYTDLKSREDAAIARQRGDIDYGRAVGAPSRQRYEDSFGSGFNVNSIIPQSALDTAYQGLLRGLSTQGNPYGNPGGLTEAQNYITGNLILPELNRYRTMNAQTGGYGSYAGSGAAVPGTNSSLPGSVSTMSNTANALGPAMQSAKADAGTYDALGYGLGNVLNPPTDFSKLLKAFGGGNNRYMSLT